MALRGSVQYCFMSCSLGSCLISWSIPSYPSQGSSSLYTHGCIISAKTASQCCAVSLAYLPSISANTVVVSPRAWLPSYSSPEGCVTSGCCTGRQRTCQCSLSSTKNIFKGVKTVWVVEQLQSGTAQTPLYQRETPISPWPQALKPFSSLKLLFLLHSINIIHIAL